MRDKFAFTLAEVMIVLAVIGVLSAVLVPVIQKTKVDNNLLRFKNAHETLYKSVQELVTSDKYYLDGDLGTKPNGQLLDGTHSDDTVYFCDTLADLLEVKTKNCKEHGTTESQVAMSGGINGVVYAADIWCKSIQANNCSSKGSKIGHVITKNNIIYFEANSKVPFGFKFSEYGRTFPMKALDSEYKGICLDIDEWCKGEDAFGYGIKADGHILPSKRAKEWLEKSISQKD